MRLKTSGSHGGGCSAGGGGGGECCGVEGTGPGLSPPPPAGGGEKGSVTPPPVSSGLTSFPCRPLAGLFRWASTPVSITMGVVGLIILKLDRLVQPDATPLRDSYDFLQRLRKWGNGKIDHSWVMASFDFDALCTRVQWSKVAWCLQFFAAVGWFPRSTIARRYLFA